MLAGSGYYHMAGDQLDRFRHALDSDAIGGEIVAITDSLREGSGVLGDRGVEDRAAWVREGPSASRCCDARVSSVPGIGNRQSGCRPRPSYSAREAWEVAAPMNAWLDAHVGPSTLAPDEGALALRPR
jgi:hypothetical protein